MQTREWRLLRGFSQTPLAHNEVLEVSPERVILLGVLLRNHTLDTRQASVHWIPQNWVLVQMRHNVDGFARAELVRVFLTLTVLLATHLVEGRVTVHRKVARIKRLVSGQGRHDQFGWRNFCIFSFQTSGFTLNLIFLIRINVWGLDRNLLFYLESLLFNDLLLVFERLLLQKLT